MRIVILGSGSGSNAKAIIQAQQAGQLGKANCVALAADREGVPFLGHAAILGIPAELSLIHI